MLREYLKENKIGQIDFAKKIGVSFQTLHNIFKNKSPETKVYICLAIEKETGLQPWEYLDNLEPLKKLMK